MPRRHGCPSNDPPAAIPTHSAPHGLIRACPQRVAHHWCASTAEPTLDRHRSHRSGWRVRAHSGSYGYEGAPTSLAFGLCTEGIGPRRNERSLRLVPGTDVLDKGDLNQVSHVL